MAVKTNKSYNEEKTDLDRKASNAATRVAEKYGLKDRAVNTFFAMTNEVLEELQPAIEAQAKTDAELAAKTRLKEIMALPEAAERRDLAQGLAIDTDSSVEQIKSILASSPVARAHHDPLATLMAGKTPGISSDDGGDDGYITGESETDQAANFILKAGEG